MPVDYLADNAVCINLATRRRDGREVLTPVWYTVIDGRLYLRTASRFGKLRRIRHTPEVRFAICTFEGELTGDWHDASARILEPGDPLATIADRQLNAKYSVDRDHANDILESMDDIGVYVEVTPAT